MKRYLFFIFLNLFCSVAAWATAPLFVVTPLVKAPTSAYQGQMLTAIYQIINNTKYNLNNLTIVNLPAGVAQVITTDASYCNSNPINLSASSVCLLKVQINISQANTLLQWNPQVCMMPGRTYCSQAYPSDQVSVTVASGAAPADCPSNTGNFNFELGQQLDSGAIVPGWGVPPIAIQSSWNTCASGAQGTLWQQQRVLAAAEFWIPQKINYCHHYMPDWSTPPSEQCSAYAAGGSMGGCCSFEPDLDPASPLFQQIVRWNYSNQNSETVQYWQNYNRMWYGMDCTNYTRLLYNFAFGTLFTGDTPSQAGQNPDGTQASLSPNQQTTGNVLNYSCAPGTLLCGDGSLDQNNGTFCSGHGGMFAVYGIGNYFSIIDQNGTVHNTDPAVIAMIQSQLSILQVGDLVYIAGDLDTGLPSSNNAVTHAVMWTGKTVGYGADNINPTQVAPDQYCTAASNCSWKGADNIGAWVITDSHYQGADYRVFTNYFYLEDLWGVRRVIGSWAPGTNCHPPE